MVGGLPPCGSGTSPLACEPVSVIAPLITIADVVGFAGDAVRPTGARQSLSKGGAVV